MRKLLISLLTLLLTACEREIPLDYHTTQPLYVAEMTLTPSSVSARITTTQDMDETTATRHYVEGATITIGMAGSEWVDTLEYQGQGRYSLPYFAMEGYDFVADIAIDGRHYTSTSKMLSAPVINSFEFVWQDMLTEKVLFGELRLQDKADENNYYFMHLYRNGTGYRWAVMRDTSNPGGERGVVPPGICAEYGYLLLNPDSQETFNEHATKKQKETMGSVGSFREKGLKMLQLEIELYPESATFIAPLIKKFSQQ